MKKSAKVFKPKSTLEEVRKQQFDSSAYNNSDQNSEGIQDQY